MTQGHATSRMPPADFAGTTKYSILPREKRAFHTVLDAHKILPATRATPMSEVALLASGDEVVVALDHPIAGGHLREEMRLTSRRRRADDARACRARCLDAGGQIVRRGAGPGLPPRHRWACRWPRIPRWRCPSCSAGCRSTASGAASTRGSTIASSPRCTSRSKGGSRISIGGTTHDTIEVIMYPDLNDWIPMGAMITRLVKPFVPKYRMWYAAPAAARPHTLRGSVRAARGPRGGARGHALTRATSLPWRPTGRPRCP